MKIKITRIDGIAVVLIVAGFIVSLVFYALFPTLVPIHWNSAGLPDQYASKLFGAFFMPTLILLIYLIISVVPAFDPKRERYQEFATTYSLFKLIIVSVFLVIYILAGLAALGYPVPVSTLVPLMVGILILLMGTQLNKVKTNWFMGIRTPWTLSDDRVWDKTHNIGSVLFKIGGILFAISALLPLPYNTIGFVLVLVIIVIVPVVYSYWQYRLLHKDIK